MTVVQSADEKMVHFKNWLIKALPNRNVNVESLHFLAKKQRFIGLSARQNFVLLRRTIMQSGKLHEFPCEIRTTWRQNFVKSVRFVAMQYIGQKLARQVKNPLYVCHRSSGREVEIGEFGAVRTFANAQGSRGISPEGNL
jgi:hypothetical protein